MMQSSFATTSLNAQQTVFYSYIALTLPTPRSLFPVFFTAKGRTVSKIAKPHFCNLYAPVTPTPVTGS